VAKVVRKLVTQNGEPNGFMFFCPGCGCGHAFDDKKWVFNGDMEKPTLDPSYLTAAANSNFQKRRCHSYIREGVIQFLSDCYHELKGQAVPLEDF